MKSVTTFSPRLLLLMFATLVTVPLGVFGADADFKDTIDANVANILAGRHGLRPIDGADVNDVNNQRHLLSYIRNENMKVRCYVLHMLGRVRDPNLIEVLSDCLDDEEPGVAAIALDHLFSYPRDVLRQRCSENLTDRLTKLAWRWSESSVKALLLLADLDQKQEIPELLKILHEANALQSLTRKTEVIPQMNPATLADLYKRGIIDDRLVPFPKVKSACLKALFKMGEKEGEQAVLAALAGDDLASRVFAIEAIEYASRKDHLKNLLPLLDDNRNAKPGIEFFGSGTTYIKVRDLAVNTIAHISGASFSFKIGKLMNYRDAQVDEVREFLKKY